MRRDRIGKISEENTQIAQIKLTHERNEATAIAKGSRNSEEKQGLTAESLGVVHKEREIRLRTS